MISTRTKVSTNTTGTPGDKTTTTSMTARSSLRTTGTTITVATSTTINHTAQIKAITKTIRVTTRAQTKIVTRMIRVTLTQRATKTIMEATTQSTQIQEEVIKAGRRKDPGTRTASISQLKGKDTMEEGMPSILVKIITNMQQRKSESLF